MNPINIVFVHKRQRGIGLVEVMVSLVIGLVLLGAMTYILIGGNLMGRTDTDVSRMQENARIAMDLIGRSIRQAGYRLEPSRKLGATSANAEGVMPISGNNGSGTGASATPDDISLRYDPALVNYEGIDKIPKGREPNCAGSNILSNNTLTTVNAHIVDHTFEITKGQLWCRTFNDSGGKNSVLIADNIENLQIEYGLDTTGNGVISSYIAAPTNLQFKQVAAVRVSLLLRGANANIAANKTQTYTYNNEATTVTDGFLRQIYTTTFAVRNPIQ